jgi:hypothetical protein
MLGAFCLRLPDHGDSAMKTYSAFLQRVIPNAGPRANFKTTVQAVSSEMARITAEAQYPGYKCANAPVPVR